MPILIFLRFFLFLELHEPVYGTDGQTEGQTDGRTDRRTGKTRNAAYRTVA